MIVAARELLEEITGLQFVTATYVIRLPGYAGFPSELEMRPNPVQSISSVAYVDENGASQTLASTVYQAAPFTHPAILQLAYDQSWPMIRPQANAITITFVAGFGAAAAVPQKYKHTIKQGVKFLYDHRDQVDFDWFRAFLAQHKTGWLF